MTSPRTLGTRCRCTRRWPPPCNRKSACSTRRAGPHAGARSRAPPPGAPPGRPAGPPPSPSSRKERAMLAFLRQQMQDLLTKRAPLKTAVDAAIEAPTRENRNLTDAEQTAFTAAREALQAHDAEVEELQGRI